MKLGMRTASRFGKRHKSIQDGKEGGDKKIFPTCCSTITSTNLEISPEVRP